MEDGIGNRVLHEGLREDWSEKGENGHRRRRLMSQHFRFLLSVFFLTLISD